MNLSWPVIALLLLVLGVAAGAAVLVWRRRQAARRARFDDDEGWPLPPLVFPGRTIHDAAPEPATPRPPWATPHAADPAASAGARELLETEEPIAAPADDAGETEVGVAVAAGPIRFHRPPEGTLQLLPGRLEILSGNEEQEEIRFVRVAGRDTVVTFGRSRGEPHLHVQLQSRTVSRRHASLSFRAGAWYVSNQSRTNPVVLNGRQLPATDSDPARLDDGDQIEMGEVVFRFRAR